MKEPKGLTRRNLFKAALALAGVAIAAELPGGKVIAKPTQIPSGDAAFAVYPSTPTPRLQSRGRQRIFWIRPGTQGNDAWDGSCSVHIPNTGRGPKRSFREAYRLMRSGDTLYIGDGVYQERNL